MRVSQIFHLNLYCIILFTYHISDFLCFSCPEACKKLTGFRLTCAGLKCNQHHITTILSNEVPVFDNICMTVYCFKHESCPKAIMDKFPIIQAFELGILLAQLERAS